MPIVVHPEGARSKTCSAAQKSSPVFVPEDGRSSVICEAATVLPEQHLPYIFELRTTEALEFLVRSDIPINLLLCRMVDYDRWAASGYDSEVPSRVYMEAVEIVAHGMSLTPPTEEAYVAVLNQREPKPSRWRCRNPALFACNTMVSHVLVEDESAKDYRFELRFGNSDLVCRL